MQKMMQGGRVLPVAPGSAVDSSQLKQSLSDLRTIMATHDVSSSDQSQTNNLDMIARSLKAAIVGAAGSSSDATCISALDAIKLLCDAAKVFTL
jgi:hypothetical protein